MAIPEKPISRIEHYLARANGQNVTPPDPISRIEHYLAGIAGGVPQELLNDVAELKSQMDEKAPAIMQTVSDQAVASFADGADDMPLKSLVVAINPVQAGTGDPSPENVRPISGYDSVTVTRAGVNVWDEEWELGGISSSGNNDSASDRIRSKNYIMVLPNTTYYVKSTNTNTVGLRLYDANKTIITTQVVTNNTYTMPSNCRYIRFVVLNTTTYNHDISINYPSTDHDYHPGTVASVELQLGQTVYGGTVDVVSGEMVVDRAMVIAADDGEWRYYVAGGSYGYVYYRSIITGTDGSKIKCNIAPNVNNTTDLGITRSDNGMIQIYCNAIGVTSLADWRTYLHNNTVQIVYPLDTPITITLTPEQLTTVLGQNNIFADTGNVTVIYPADTKTYIDNQIAALQALVLENTSNS